MNESQQTSLNALLEVECKMTEGGAEQCDGPWCTARKNIIAAFNLVQETVDTDVSTDA